MSSDVLWPSRRVLDTFVEDTSPMMSCPFLIDSDDEDSEVFGSTGIPEVSSKVLPQGVPQIYKPPILVQSPRVSTEDIVILPDEDFVPQLPIGDDYIGPVMGDGFTNYDNNKEFDDYIGPIIEDTTNNDHMALAPDRANFDNTLAWGQFKPVMFSPDNAPKPIPEDCQTPTHVLIEAQLLEAQDELKKAVNEWKARISREEEASIERTESLLAKHAQELAAFDNENRVPRMTKTSPQVLDIKLTKPGLYKAVLSPRCGIRTQIQTNHVSAEIRTRRKQITDRHKMELLALDSEYNTALKNLKERRNTDIALKKSKIEALSSELEKSSGEMEIPFDGPLLDTIKPPARMKSVRVIRMSVKKRNGIK